MNVDKLKRFPDQNIEARPTECVGETVADIIGNIVGVPMDAGFTYAATFALLGTEPSTQGEDPIAAMDAAVSYGALPIGEEDFDATTNGELFEANFSNFSDIDKASAREYAIKYKLNGVKPLATFDDIVAYIEKTGWGVNLPMLWYQNFNVPPPSGILQPPGGVFSSHDVAVYGLSDDGRLILKPCLGPTFGDGGYCYLDRETFALVQRGATGFDAEAIRIISTLGYIATYRVPALVQYLPGFITNLLTSMQNITPPAPPTHPVTQPILWDTPKHIWHAVRVRCDTVGLTFLQKTILCMCIWQESQFDRYAVSPPNKNGTRDYGLCQFNNGHSAKTGEPYWIGPHCLFSSVQDVFDHPERAANYMIWYYKHTGNLDPWSSYSTGAYKQHLASTSPVWKLAEA